MPLPVKLLTSGGGPCPVIHSTTVDCGIVGLPDGPGISQLTAETGSAVAADTLPYRGDHCSVHCTTTNYGIVGLLDGPCISPSDGVPQSL